MIDGSIIRRDGEEFDCIDCGIRVFTPVRTAANDVNLCCVCLFIRELPAEEREKVRRHLIGGIKEDGGHG